MMTSFLEGHSFGSQDEGLFVLPRLLIHICQLDSRLNAVFINIDGSQEAFFGRRIVPSSKVASS
jgi:hypothetical protein